MLQKLWKDAYAAFRGAFDNPIARQKQDDELAKSARHLLSQFNEEMERPDLEDLYLDALAKCRDAFEEPPRGSDLEHLFLAAFADPMAVPAYVQACIQSGQRKARELEQKAEAL